MRGTFPIWLLLRIDQDGVMATKVAIEKPAVAEVAPKAAANAAILKRSASKTKRSKTRPCPLSHVPNAVTRKVIRDANAGKNLLSYASLEEMFDDLGM
jgi:hypothetical protein